MLMAAGASAQALIRVAERVQASHKRGKTFARANLFSRLSSHEPAMQQVLKKGSMLQLDKTARATLRKERPEALTLRLPYDDGSTLTLELVRNQVLAPDFKVTTAAPDPTLTAYNSDLYYQGIVTDTKGRSLAVISVVGNEVVGVLDVEGQGNFVLGALDKDKKGRYAFFRSDDLQMPATAGCEADKLAPIAGQTTEQISQQALDPNRCVRIYFECEYNMFQTRGSTVQGTVDYMTAVYNVVKTLYDNEQVNTAISEIFVWNTPDSYPTGIISDALNGFRTARANNFNGDVAHLVSMGAPSGSGVAYINVLCNKSYSFAYSYTYNSFSQFPTYSRPVEVLTHERGHNQGSPHTHACQWDVDGNGSATEMIDGCGPNRGYTEGSCTVAPLPTNGRTIISYCHLVSGVGINFNNGFGTLPGNLIRSRVYNASCLTACNTCSTTVAISKNDVSGFVQLEL